MTKLISQQWKADEFRRFKLALSIAVIRVVIAVVVYFSRFFLFINEDRDFHQDQSGKSVKTTKLTSQQWKADEFRRFRLAVGAGPNFRLLNFRDLFFPSTTIRTFIKTAVVSHLKWLKLPIKDEKLMNLGDPSSLSLPAWISITSIAVVLSGILAWVRSGYWPFCLARRFLFSLGCSKSHCRRPVFVVSYYIWPEF